STPPPSPRIPSDAADAVACPQATATSANPQEDAVADPHDTDADADPYTLPPLQIPTRRCRPIASPAGPNHGAGGARWMRYGIAAAEPRSCLCGVAALRTPLPPQIPGAATAANPRGRSHSTNGRCRHHNSSSLPKYQGRR
uniref:Uncharacterized protein n=1 Tax=Triticum urartu TaxID=4572 RepID=A0A8R7PSJ2_TRIUA